VKRLISRTSFVLKGSGWYSDLYASPGAKKDGERSRPSGDKAAASEVRREVRDAKPRPPGESKPARSRTPRQGEGQVEGRVISRRRSLLSSAPVETIVVDGLALAQEIRKELSEAVGRHVARGRRAPHLAVVRVGDDPRARPTSRASGARARASGSTRPRRTCPRRPPRTSSTLTIAELNGTQHVDGILVQLPLPKQIDRSDRARDRSGKDVDGLHPINAGRLLQGTATLVACTPLGIMEILRRYDVRSRAPTRS
jgi:hypothetical protein